MKEACPSHLRDEPEDTTHKPDDVPLAILRGLDALKERPPLAELHHKVHIGFVLVHIHKAHGIQGVTWRVKSDDFRLRIPGSGFRPWTPGSGLLEGRGQAESRGGNL